MGLHSLMRVRTFLCCRMATCVIPPPKSIVPNSEKYLTSYGGAEATGVAVPWLGG